MISDRVKAICRAENIPEQEMMEMVRRSALHTHGKFNRKFHNWLLDIRGGVCHNVQMDLLMTVGTTVRGGWVEEEHYGCGGEGCPACGWVGVVRRLF